MDITNTASLLTVFLGLNLASSLVDKFSQSISDTLIGKHLVNRNISKLEFQKKELLSLKEKAKETKNTTDNLNKIAGLEKEVDFDINHQMELKDNVSSI